MRQIVSPRILSFLIAAFLCCAGNARPVAAAQRIELSSDAFRQLSRALEGEVRLSLARGRGVARMLPLFSTLGFEDIRFRLPVGSFFETIEELELNHLELSLRGDAIVVDLLFDDGRIGNGFARFALAGTRVTTELRECAEACEGAVLSPGKTLFTAELKKSGNPVYDAFFEGVNARKQLDRLANLEARDQVTLYFAKPGTQRALLNLLLYAAEVTTGRPWSAVVPGQVKVRESSLSFLVE